MRFLSILFFSFLSITLSAQSFYDMGTVQTIEITFAQSNWDQVLDAAKAGDDGYTLAESVTINGEVFDSVGVKYKGNSTYQPNQTKNPFHIELNHFKDHDYEGYVDIKLSNGAKDPSMVREVLSYNILRQYMDAPLANYANVFVNGNLIGLYSNVEAINKPFVRDRFGSRRNTFVKCNPPAGAGPGSDDFPDLQYLGEDSSAYYAGYEMKSDDGWAELIDLCDTLENTPEALDQILDIDRALWMLAFNNVLVNLDSYLGRFRQNYYLYRQDNGRFAPIVWDLNESFGRFADTGAGGPPNPNALVQMSPFLHQNDNDWPLVRELLNEPTYQRAYLAHCRTILEENFANGSYQTTGETLQATIAADVQADPNYLFSYANFQTNLTSNVSGGGGGPGGGNVVGITTLMEARTDYLLDLPALSAQPPTIGEPMWSNENPTLGETVTLTATITDASTAYVGFRSDVRDVFERLPLFDDGQHGDGAAGDGVYGLTLTVDQPFNQYYLYAENTAIGRFLPRRAEYEFFELNANLTQAAGDLVINEFLASNDMTQADQDGEFDDWIELYNNGTETIDISGYTLSDDPEDVAKWPFPAGTSIAPSEYLIVWADDDQEQEGFHTQFKLSADGESVILTDANGEQVDRIDFGPQETDIAFGRFPNGTGDFRDLPPTFAAMNDDMVATRDLPATQIELFPNPTSGQLTVQLNELGVVHYEVVDLTGRRLLQAANTDRVQLQIDASVLPAGTYSLRLLTDGAVYSRLFVVQ